MKKYSCFWFLLLLLACGGGEEPVRAEDDNGGSSPGDIPLPDIDLVLTITDSIGIELGDSNYVFGMPILAEFTPDGNIAVLDAQKMGILFYTPEGEYIRTVGREGSGPGEFLLPTSFSFIPDGGLVVADAMAGKVVFFDSTYEYSSDVSGFFPSPPVTVRGVEGGAFAGLQSVFEQNDDGMFLGFKLVRWEGEDFSETVEYFATLNQFDPTDIASAIQDNMFFFTSSPDGRVYRTPFSSKEFIIEGYMPDGTSFLYICDEDYQKVPKSDEEIQIEIDLVNSRLASSGMPPGAFEWEPDPYRSATYGLFIDAEDRIWVRLGYYREVVFRIYDQDGNLRLNAMLDYRGDFRDVETWQVIVNEYGILAFDPAPEDYPRIYILAVSEGLRD